MIHTHTHSGRIYPESAYDKYFSLKPPLPLWLAILFLARQITLPLCMGIAHVFGVDERALALIRQEWNFDFTIVAALPAATLLYLFFRRVPTVSTGVRWIWSRGGLLLVASASMDIAANSLAIAHSIGDLTLMPVLNIGIDIVIIGYSFISERLRDTFADFPTESSL